MRRGRSRRWLRATALGTALLLSGCGSTSSSGTRAASVPTRPTTPALIQIVAPAPNQHTGSVVEAKLRLDNAHVAPPGKVGGILHPDEGHIHLTLDGRLVAMPSQLDARLPRLSTGPHTLEAEFVASDHLPFENRVVAAVSFEVRDR